MNPCRGIGGSHRKLLDGAGGKLATVATSPADSEESSLGVPEVAPPSSQHRNSITPPSVHAFVLILFVFLFFSHFVWSLYVLSFSLSLSLSLCTFVATREHVDTDDARVGIGTGGPVLRSATRLRKSKRVSSIGITMF